MSGCEEVTNSYPNEESRFFGKWLLIERFNEKVQSNETIDFYKNGTSRWQGGEVFGGYQLISWLPWDVENGKLLIETPMNGTFSYEYKFIESDITQLIFFFSHVNTTDIKTTKFIRYEDVSKTQKDDIEIKEMILGSWKQIQQIYIINGTNKTYNFTKGYRIKTYYDNGTWKYEDNASYSFWQYYKIENGMLCSSVKPDYLYNCHNFSILREDNDLILEFVARNQSAIDRWIKLE